MMRATMTCTLDHRPDLQVILDAFTATTTTDTYFPSARPNQLAPDGDWSVWLIQAGRGYGKTRTGAEWLIDQALTHPGTRWAILAPTFADARDTCVEGDSGILAVLERRGRRADATWNRSLGEVILTNGSRIKLFSGDEPERLRGPQHHGAWCDEPASLRRPDAWDQLMFGLRLGTKPRTVVTGTPKPVALVRTLVARAGDGSGQVIRTTGATRDNFANLASAAVDELEARYGGTRLGRQELDGELLDDTPGALWTLDLIDLHRVSAAPDLATIVVAVDPAVTYSDASDLTGIVAAGVGHDGDVYVLGDWTSPEPVSPERWATRVVDAHDHHAADHVVAETNNGGDLVVSVIHTVDPTVPVRKVTASRGKQVRAEPVAALYEQGRVHHVGVMAELEDQLTSWTPDAAKSPDRLDALVWAVTDLAVTERKRRRSIVARAA
jgi:phage terminase large subunit-like protein